MTEGPDKFGIRKVNALTAVADALESEQVKPWKDPPQLTTREWIAKLIRELTYRELCQISDELRKCDASCLNESDVNMAKILDDWAHMVQDERVGSDDLINMA